VMEPFVIETARLRLRPLTLEDADELHRLFVEPGVRKFLWDDEVIPKERAESTIETSINSFETRGFGLWAVSPRTEAALIGFSGFWFFHDPPQLELLYGLSESYWNMGLATELARAMLGYGFEELRFVRVEASTDAANVASQRVMQKAGMAFWKRECTNGLDTVYYAVTREAFR
ncbi:MAG TPA: GNAT family N-acetyltransferase, partial [Pyrinomonadaceae bacterium]|nr:GNAT family N-acetyltransferase [Pyrinomonadaceae bacterium]